MSFELRFLPTALKEWRGLDASIRGQFKKKLAEGLENPNVPQSRLRNFPNVYKIKKLLEDDSLNPKEQE